MGVYELFLKPELLYLYTSTTDQKFEVGMFLFLNEKSTFIQ